jgi:hypothetical protein
MSWLLIMLSLLGADPTTSRDRVSAASSKTAATGWQTGVKLTAALDQPVIATWQNAELRPVLQALGEQRHVAIVLDRRLDPQYLVTLSPNGDSLRDVLGQLADRVGGLVSVTGQTIYIGPTNSAAKLRTLLSLRQEELQQPSTQLPAGRRTMFSGQRPLHWADLETPGEVVLKLIHERDPKLVIQGEALIPHDLWAAGETPPVSLVEGLTLILIQVDLTYQFDSTGTVLKIIPIPEKVAIERRFPLPKAKATEISNAVRIEAPRLETRATAEQLVAIGTQEQMDELDRIIRSISTGQVSPKKSTAPAPLSKRRITFQAQDVSLQAVMDKLATTGIQFEYDRDELSKSGIKLDQLVKVDVKDAKLSEMFEQLFGPAGIAFTIDGLKVKLTAIAGQKQ